VWVLEQRLGSLHGRRIAVLGLAFKPGTDDMRDAPSLMLISALAGTGAEVVAHDPVAAANARRLLPDSVAIVDTVDEAITDADAVIVVTEWPEYKELLSESLAELPRRPLLVDGRNCLDPDDAIAVGWEYVGGGGGASAWAGPRCRPRSTSAASTRSSTCWLTPAEWSRRTGASNPRQDALPGAVARR
jgi:hypothetical protein